MPTHLDQTPDRELLARYRKQRDELAFAALVSRHGPMVLATARRLVGEEAEDVLQATFLALATQGDRIRKGDALPGWLHMTARRCALARRDARERELSRRVDHLIEIESSGSVETPAASAQRREMESILDEEIARLPAPLRSAVVACDLEGVSRAEAARRLSLPPTTLVSRLAKAHRLLAKRLGRRGVAITAAGAGAWLIGCAGRCPAMAPDLAAAITRTATSSAAAVVASGWAATASGVAANVVPRSWPVRLACLVCLLLLLGLLVPRFRERPRPTGSRNSASVATFFDDFDDGSVADDSPGEWRTGSNVTVVDGSLVLTSAVPEGQGPGSGNGANAYVEGKPLIWEDGTFRTRLRMQRNVGSVAGFNIRCNFTPSQHEEGYFAVISHRGRLSIGHYSAAPYVQFKIEATSATPLEPWREDIDALLVLEGSTIDFSVHGEGDPTRRHRLVWTDPEARLGSGRVGPTFLPLRGEQSVAFRFYAADARPRRPGSKFNVSRSPSR